MVGKELNLLLFTDYIIVYVENLYNIIGMYIRIKFITIEGQFKIN